MRRVVPVRVVRACYQIASGQQSLRAILLWAWHYSHDLLLCSICSEEILRRPGATTRRFRTYFFVTTSITVRSNAVRQAIFFVSSEDRCGRIRHSPGYAAADWRVRASRQADRRRRDRSRSDAHPPWQAANEPRPRPFCALDIQDAPAATCGLPGRLRKRRWRSTHRRSAQASTRSAKRRRLLTAAPSLSFPHRNADASARP